MVTLRVNVGLRIPDDLNRSLTGLAKEKGMSKNALMLQILWDYIEKKGAA